MNLKNLTTLLGATLMLALAMAPTATARSDLLEEVEAPDYGALPQTPDTPDVGIDATALRTASVDICVWILSPTGWCGSDQGKFATFAYVIYTAQTGEFGGCVSSDWTDPLLC